MYPSPRPKRARLSHAVAPPLPTEPACAGLRRGPDFSPCHLPLHKGGFWPGACSDVVLSGEILPISSLKSDNRNTAVPRPPCVKGAVTVGDWGIVSGGELGNLRILQQAQILIKGADWRTRQMAPSRREALGQERSHRAAKPENVSYRGSIPPTRRCGLCIPRLAPERRGKSRSRRHTSSPHQTRLRWALAGAP